MIAGDDARFDFGKFFRKFREGQLQLGTRVAPKIAETKAGKIAVRDLRSLPAYLFIIRGQDQACLIKLLAGRSQGKAAVSAVKKLKAQLALQRLDLLGDCGLGNKAFFRGFGKAAASYDSLKVSELTEQEIHLLSMFANFLRVPFCQPDTVREAAVERFLFLF